MTNQQAEEDSIIKPNGLIEIAVFDGVFDEGEWRKRANCRSKGNEPFFVETRGGASVYFEARCICYHCPVRENCLQFAVENSIRDGMWGGLTYRERLKYARGERSSEITIFDLVKGLRGPNQTIKALADKLAMSEERIRQEIRKGNRR